MYIKRMNQTPKTVFNVIGSRVKPATLQGYPDPVFVMKNGSWTTDKAFIYWCGCQSVVSYIRRALEAAGYMREDVPETRSGDLKAKEYIRQHKLDVKYPPLDTEGGSFAYLIARDGSEAVNITHDPNKILPDVKRLLKGVEPNGKHQRIF